MKHLTVVLSCVVGVLLGVALGLRDPYTRIEAESMDVNEGVGISESPTASQSKVINLIHPGDYIGFKQLNFSTETAAFEWRSYSVSAGYPQVSLQLDTPTSTPFLTYSNENVGQWLTSSRLIAIDERPRGIHDLYITFEHPRFFRTVAMDWFRFVTLDSLTPPSYHAGTVVDCPTPQPCTCVPDHDGSSVPLHSQPLTA